MQICATVNKLMITRMTYSITSVEGNLCNMYDTLRWFVHYFDSDNNFIQLMHLNMMTRNCKLNGSSSVHVMARRRLPTKILAYLIQSCQMHPGAQASVKFKSKYKSFENVVYKMAAILFRSLLGNTSRPKKMAAILQTTFSNAFSWLKIAVFLFKCHWNLFPMIQLAVVPHWLR